MILPVGNRFVILRGHDCVGLDDRLPIILAPGRAFGSGEHETTRSCLEELEALRVLPATRVLDLMIDATIVRTHQHAAGAKGAAKMRPSGVRAAA